MYGDISSNHVLIFSVYLGSHGISLDFSRIPQKLIEQTVLTYALIFIF